MLYTIRYFTPSPQDVVTAKFLAGHRLEIEPRRGCYGRIVHSERIAAAPNQVINAINLFGFGQRIKSLKRRGGRMWNVVAHTAQRGIASVLDPPCGASLGGGFR